MKTYSELIRFQTFEERYRYLQLCGIVGEETFGCDRFLNQVLYKDPAWRSIRNQAIIRDGACDMAIQDRPIIGTVFVHHINPISKADILQRSKSLFDLENLICVSHFTHNAIHYGNESLLMASEPIIRRANDTCPWKH